MVEEDTVAIPYRNRMLEKACQVVSAKRWLLSVGYRITYLLVLDEKRRDYRKYLVRMQPDIILGLLDEGIIPCFNNTSGSELRKEIILKAISSETFHEDAICGHLGHIRDWAIREIVDRSKDMLKCSKAEKNGAMDIFRNSSS